MVFEENKPKRLIGFDREPLPVVEVVQHVPASELKAYHEQLELRKKGHP